ncbi:unnamed protein product [Chrysoparadoxa australica]
MRIHDKMANLLYAQRNGKLNVVQKTTPFYTSVLNQLVQLGYVKGYSAIAPDAKNTSPRVKVFLKYHQGQPVIKTINMISKPSHPRYVNIASLSQLCQGTSTFLISTPQVSQLSSLGGVSHTSA